MKEVIAGHENKDLRRIVIISGGFTMLIGLLAMAERISGLNPISAIYPDYLPMAPVTGLMASVFGIIFLSGLYRSTNPSLRLATIIITLIMAIYGLLIFVEYLTGTAMTLEQFLFPEKQLKGGIPFNHASPVSGLLFFLCCLATLFKISGRERHSSIQTICSLGVIVGYAGFTGMMGYVFGTPLLYGWNIIPIAFPTTLVFLLLGSGLVAMSGPDSFILKQVSGNSSSARVLRAILPIIFIFLIADDIVDAFLSQFTAINHVMISAAFALVLIPVLIIIIIRVSQGIFRRAEVAEDARILAEEALRESEKRYRVLISRLGEGIGLVDPEEYFVFANPAAERIFGVDEGALISRNLKDFILPEQHALLNNENEKRARAEQSTYEIEIISADQQKRFLLVTATPQFNDAGTFTGTFGVFRDITERKNVEAKLEKFTKALQDSNATKDKFFSIIAHDLKGPFNSILGLTNLLISENQSFNENEIEYTLNTIKKSSEKAFELLENLLMWASSQTGQITFAPQSFNLQNSIDENLALLEIQAARKKIHVFSTSDNDYIAFGDKQMVQTILRNLISNAVKFSSPGGEVSVSVNSVENNYVVSVKDTVVGIAEKDITKLFKIETKYSTAGTSNEKGTGLGLILCKEFVEKNGGRIWVESSVGIGSTFSFCIPIYSKNQS